MYIKNWNLFTVQQIIPKTSIFTVFSKFLTNVWAKTFIQKTVFFKVVGEISQNIVGKTQNLDLAQKI